MVNDQNKKALDDTINQLKSSVPKGTQMPAIIKQQIDALKAQVSNAELERKELSKQLEARQILPIAFDG